MNSELKEYEKRCSRCGGTGIEIKEIYYRKSEYKCKFCDGTGKIDWLEKVFENRKMSIRI
jgi:DnaJ-class molecular chaperone